MRKLTVITATAILASLAMMTSIGCGSDGGPNECLSCPEDGINCGIWEITTIEKNCETGEVITMETITDTLCLEQNIQIPICEVALSEQSEPFGCTQTDAFGPCEVTVTVSGSGRSTPAEFDIDFMVCTTYSQACEDDKECECVIFEGRKIGNVRIDVTTPAATRASVSPDPPSNTEEAKRQRYRAFIEQLATRQ